MISWLKLVGIIFGFVQHFHVPFVESLHKQILSVYCSTKASKLDGFGARFVFGICVSETKVLVNSNVIRGKGTPLELGRIWSEVCSVLKTGFWRIQTSSANIIQLRDHPVSIKGGLYVGKTAVLRSSAFLAVNFTLKHVMLQRILYPIRRSKFLETSAGRTYSLQWYYMNICVTAAAGTLIYSIKISTKRMCHLTTNDI